MHTFVLITLWPVLFFLMPPYRFSHMYTFKTVCCVCSQFTPWPLTLLLRDRHSIHVYYVHIHHTALHQSVLYLLIITFCNICLVTNMHFFSVLLVHYLIIMVSALSNSCKGTLHLYTGHLMQLFQTLLCRYYVFSPNIITTLFHNSNKSRK